MLPYDKLQRGFNLPINKDLAGVLLSIKGTKNVPAKTKLEDARQLRRQVLKHSD